MYGSIKSNHGFELRYESSHQYLQYAETDEESKEGGRIRFLKSSDPGQESLKDLASYTE
jgi:hypothetical protein